MKSSDSETGAPLPPPCDCNNGSLRRAARSLGQFYDDALAPSGLRATQYGLLAQIDAADRPRMSELAQRLVMDLSALGHSLKPLIREGFVLLSPDLHDGRIKRVALTAEGRAKLCEAKRFWMAAQARFDTAFGAREAANLRACLDGLASDDFMARLAGTRASPRPDEAPAKPVSRRS